MTADDSAGKLAREITEALDGRGWSGVGEPEGFLRPILARFIEERDREKDAEWSGWGTIEVAIRNPNVSSFMDHWTTRAEKAEAECAKLREERDAMEAAWGEIESERNAARKQIEEARADITECERVLRVALGTLQEKAQAERVKCAKSIDDPTHNHPMLRWLEAIMGPLNVLQGTLAARALLKEPSVPVTEPCQLDHTGDDIGKTCRDRTMAGGERKTFEQRHANGCKGSGCEYDADLLAEPPAPVAEFPPCSGCEKCGHVPGFGECGYCGCFMHYAAPDPVKPKEGE